MAAPHRAWNHSVDERIKIIAKGLEKHDNLQDKLPGLKELLGDYLDPQNVVGTDADQECFHRRLLQVFRDSQADFTYDDWLKTLSADEQKRVVDFVDGQAVDDVCKGFDFGPSIGVREHVDLMLKAEAGPVFVDGLNTKEDAEHHGHFHKFLRGLVESFESRRGDSIVVGASDAHL